MEDLNTLQAAEYLGVTDRAMKYWRADGKGPKWYDRGYGKARIFYRVKDLDTFKRQRSSG